MDLLALRTILFLHGNIWTLPCSTDSLLDYGYHEWITASVAGLRSAQSDFATGQTTGRTE